MWSPSGSPCAACQKRREELLEKRNYRVTPPHRDIACVTWGTWIAEKKPRKWSLHRHGCGLLEARSWRTQRHETENVASYVTRRASLVRMCKTQQYKHKQTTVNISQTKNTLLPDNTYASPHGLAPEARRVTASMTPETHKCTYRRHRITTYIGTELRLLIVIEARVQTTWTHKRVVAKARLCSVKRNCRVKPARYRHGVCHGCTCIDGKKPRKWSLNRHGCPDSRGTVLKHTKTWN